MNSRILAYWRPAVAAFVVMTLTGCTVPLYNIEPALVKSSVPVENEINVASIGDPVLTSGIRMEIDAIQFEEEFKIGPISNFRFTPGHFIKRGEDDKTEFFMRSPLAGSSQVTTNPISQPFHALQIFNDETKVCAVMANGGKFCKDGLTYQRISVPTNPKAAAMQRLVYRGAADKVISFQYEEYVGGTPGPGYIEDLKHELEGTNMFEFKNALLEIVDASEETVTYRVLRSFIKNGETATN